MFSGQIIIGNAINDHKTLFERPKSAKKQQQRKLQTWKNSWNSLRSGVYGVQKDKKSAIFLILSLIFVHLFIDKRSFTDVRFFDIQKFLEKVENKKDDYFPQYLRFLKIKIRDSCSIASLNLHILWKTTGSIFKTVVMTTTLLYPYFWLNSAEHDGTLTALTEDISKPWKCVWSKF